MARVTPSPLVGSVAGKVGGVVFRGAGASATAQAAPRKARSSTTAQRLNQSALQLASARWAALDEATKSTWSQYVIQSLPPASASGRTVSSPRTAYLQWYLQMWHCGIVPAYDWPITYAYVPQAPCIVEASTAGPWSFVLKAQNLNVSAGAAVALARCPSPIAFASRPIYRTLFSGAQDGAAVWDYHPGEPVWKFWLDLSAYWAARFPEAIAGLTYQARASFAVPAYIWTPASEPTFTVS